MSSWFSEALTQPCLCAKLRAILRPIIVHALIFYFFLKKAKHQDIKRVLYDTSRTTGGLNIGSML